jgi:hypothetical protein
MKRFLSFLTLPACAALLAACGAEQAASNNKVPVPVTQPVIKDGSLMVPGRPKIASLPDRVVPGAQPITWNMWWGENGRHWAMYVNGVEVKSGDISSETPKQQQATVEVPMDKPGSYEIKVALCNDHGCSESEPTVMNVGAG